MLVDLGGVLLFCYWSRDTAHSVVEYHGKYFFLGLEYIQQCTAISSSLVIQLDVVFSKVHLNFEKIF